MEEVPDTAMPTDGAAAEAGAPLPLQLPLQQLEELVRNERMHLYRFVVRKLRDPVEAEDVVQQALTEATRTIDKFRGDSQLKTWVYGIANNLAANFRRRAAQSYNCFESDEVLESHAAEDADPAVLVERRQLLQRVVECAQELSPELVATMMAVLDGEASYQEAADSLDIPIGTVRSRVNRARSTLRRKVLGEP